MERKIRVLIANPGLDGHDRWALIISQALRDHGMEVIYLGLGQTPVQIAQAAAQQDVDVISLSSLSGSHKTLFPQIISALQERGAEDIPVIGGGVIPYEDIRFLLAQGVKKVFASESSTEALVQYIEDLIEPKKEPLPALEKIAHIGIAVHNIDQALSFYTDSLGLKLEAVQSVKSEEVKVAFLRIGESRIELLEPLEKTSAIQRFLDNTGEGIHHIAFEVTDIEERMQQLKTEGLRLIDENARQGANDSKVAFIHPKTANGVLFELCQHNKRK